MYDEIVEINMTIYRGIKYVMEYVDLLYNLTRA
jgi:hypothetical protein